MIERKQVQAQAYLHTEQAGANVPLKQAAITGGLVGLVILACVLKYRIHDGWFYALLAGLVVTCVTWLALQAHWFNLTTIERVTGWDINRDGFIGDQRQAESPRHRVLVDVYQKNEGGYSESKTAELPFSEENMRAIANGLIMGKPFTEREWTGQGKPLSVAQFREARAEMIKRGLLELVNTKAPQQGYKITRAGLAVMRHFADESPTE